jgi:hypothetical protein
LYHSKRAKFMLMMMGWSDTFCGMKSWCWSSQSAEIR